MNDIIIIIAFISIHCPYNDVYFIEYATTCTQLTICWWGRGGTFLVTCLLLSV